MVRSIVADRRYHEHDDTRSAQASWIDAVRTLIAHFMRGLLHRLDRALGVHSPFESVIGFAAIAVAFALLGFGSYLLVRSYLRRVPARAPAAIEVGSATAEQNSAVLRAAAQAAARGRRYRDAAALLFFSAVRALDERGRIAYDSARTPGEYRRLVRDPSFDALAGDAVVALFAAAEPRAELFERMSETYDRFFDAHVR